MGSPTWSNSRIHPRTGAKYSLTLSQPARLCKDELTACFDLIEEPSGAGSRATAKGWQRVGKRKEMVSYELRYILVKDVEGCLKGISSMMPCYEEGQPVDYCYEIHRKPELRG